MPWHWTTHARARNVALLLLLHSRHGLLRARGHLRVATIARMPLALMLRLLLLAMERRHEWRPLLAVLLLHVWRKALVRTGSLHHVCPRTWRSSVAVGPCSLLRNVWHLRLGVWRHRRIALVLRRHEPTGGWILTHHWRTSTHLRHVRAKVGARCKARTHRVHLGFLLAYIMLGNEAFGLLCGCGGIIICGAPGFCICL
jgi:hypothetical protein